MCFLLGTNLFSLSSSDITYVSSRGWITFVRTLICARVYVWQRTIHLRPWSTCATNAYSTSQRPYATGAVLAQTIQQGERKSAEGYSASHFNITNRELSSLQTYSTSNTNVMSYWYKRTFVLKLHYTITVSRIILELFSIKHFVAQIPAPFV